MFVLVFAQNGLRRCSVDVWSNTTTLFKTSSMILKKSFQTATSRSGSRPNCISGSKHFRSSCIVRTLSFQINQRSKKRTGPGGPRSMQKIDPGPEAHDPSKSRPGVGGTRSMTEVNRMSLNAWSQSSCTLIGEHLTIIIKTSSC